MCHKYVLRIQWGKKQTKNLKNYTRFLTIMLTKSVPPIKANLLGAVRLVVGRLVQNLENQALFLPFPIILPAKPPRTPRPPPTTALMPTIPHRQHTISNWYGHYIW